MKGANLLGMIANKAKSPSLLADTFHEGCNPEPPHIELEIKRIHFKAMTKEHQCQLQ